jgi:hypothetical protein
LLGPLIQPALDFSQIAFYIPAIYPAHHLSAVQSEHTQFTFNPLLKGGCSYQGQPVRRAGWVMHNPLYSPQVFFC